MERSEADAAPVVIEADSVVKKFGGVTAVKGVSVSVREGEIYDSSARMAQASRH